MPNFVGFTAAKEGGYVPLLPGVALSNNIESNNVDPVFQLVFKKMNKKDATTKFKVRILFCIFYTLCIKGFKEFTAKCETI